MAKNKITNKKLSILLLFVSLLLLLVILIYTPLLIVNSHFWKSRISPSFDGGNIAGSFRSGKDGMVKNIEYINPTTYRLHLRGASHGDIISLHEEYDAYWYAKEVGGNAKSIIISSPHTSNINVFRLRESGDYTLEVFHAAKRWREYLILLVLFIAPLVLGFGYIALRSIKKHKRG